MHYTCKDHFQIKSPSEVLHGHEFGGNTTEARAQREIQKECGGAHLTGPQGEERGGEEKLLSIFMWGWA